MDYISCQCPEKYEGDESNKETNFHFSLFFPNGGVRVVTSREIYVSTGNVLSYSAIVQYLEFEKINKSLVQNVDK